MISILKKIILCLAVVIILDRVCGYLFMEIFFKNTFSGESGGTINYVISKKPKLDFLILGPSRAKHSINPNTLTALGKNGHNLGINATTIINSSLIFDLLLKEGVTTKVLVLQTDLENYNKQSDSVLLDQIKRLYPYDTDTIRSYVKELSFAERLMYQSDLYKLNSKMLNVGFNFLKRNSMEDYNGYVGLPSTQYPPLDTSLSQNYVFDETTKNWEAFKKIAALAKRKDIPLIVVFPPSYKNVFFNKVEQKKLVEAMKKEGVALIVDLSDVTKIPRLENKDLWRDSLHLNSEGAEIFSELLNNELKKSLIKSPHIKSLLYKSLRTTNVGHKSNPFAQETFAASSWYDLLIAYSIPDIQRAGVLLREQRGRYSHFFKVPASSLAYRTSG